MSGVEQNPVSGEARELIDGGYLTIIHDTSLRLAPRWQGAAPRGHKLPAEQIAIAIRAYEATPQLCIDQEGSGMTFPTLRAWLDYCEHCLAEYGAYPDGT